MKTILFIITSMFIYISGTRGQDSIVVKKDPRLDVLSAKQVQINKRSAIMTSSGMYKGYRLQVQSTSDRNDAFKTKSDMLSRLPDQKCYILFQSPYFKVRLGNFLKREDAEKYRKQYANLLPQSGAYIVEDTIEYTASEEDQLN
ncbi:SPOR domain-containing protein [Chitinophagaceae bacterium LWZ2-11]